MLRVPAATLVACIRGHQTGQAYDIKADDIELLV